METQKRIFIKLRFKKLLPLQFIQQIKMKLLENDCIRSGSSIGISLIVHVLAIAVYFGIATFDKPKEPPIREISFVDLTETREVVKKIKKKNRVKIRKIEEPVLTTSIKIENNNKVTDFLNSKKRLYLDREKKQAPINLKKHISLANSSLPVKDVLRISPAKGKRRDKQVSFPAQINLNHNKKVKLASMKHGRTGIIIKKASHSAIVLNKKKLFPDKEKKVIKLDKKTSLERKEDVFAMLKETKTIITGQLANRKAINQVVPKFPLWAKKQGVGATISLYFTVMENGVVKENVVIERTSGSRDWDRLVIEALKKWKFVPLNKKGIRLDQSGIVTFQFVI